MLKAKVSWRQLARHLVPNTGTLLILGLFFLARAAGAESPAAPLVQGPASLQFSYQGMLTDAVDGSPIDGDVDMVFALYHQVEGGTPFWSESYTGPQAIEVTNGQFHVLLGSRVALNPTDMTGDLYLGITVNGEEMLPREPLVGSVVNGLVVSSDSTAMIEGNVKIGNNFWTPAFAGMDGNDLAVHGQLEQHGSGGTRVYKLGVGTDPGTSEGSLKMGGTLNMNGNDIAGLDGIRLPFKLESARSWEFRYYGTGSSTTTALRSTVDDKYFQFRNQNGSVILSIRADNESGGYLNMAGNSIRNCGALTEANLQTPDELAAERIGRFEEGDVLCWSSESNRLEKCTIADDLLIQAVADPDGRPIVIGAEVVKVLGPVRAGDFLVASSVPGYAMVNNDPAPGTVIAQALENFEDEQGLVKAMIRKW